MISDNGKRQRFSPKVPSYDMSQWGLILAGGDGTRLRSLTRKIAGDDRPKQFCPVLGRQTLLDQTRRRVAFTVSPDRTLMVLTRPHEAVYAPLLATQPTRHLVIQPENRGTAPAILYGLLRVAKMGPADSVAIFPSDHYVSDDEAFMTHVRAAFEAVRIRPELVVLLGITPEYPEGEYGWIEPAGPILGQQGGALYRVHRFWEKPLPALAQTLLVRGCLWNSFVMVARVASLLALIEDALSDLYHAFLRIWPALNTPHEREVIQDLYAQLPSTNFSDQVLVTRPEDLAVLRVSGVRWSDLGEPNRVLTTMAQQGIRTDRAVAPTLISA